MPAPASSSAMARPLGSSPTARYQGAAPPQRDHVQSDIGGAAQTVFAAVDLNHWHGRFLREAVGAAVDVAIQHHVADD